MKRIISFIVVLAMLLGTFVYAVPSGAVTYGYVKGDADDSTTVNTKDVLVLRKYLGGVLGVKDINKTAADANSDDKITTKDVLYVRQMLGGMIDKEGNNTDGRYNVNTITIGDRNISRYTVIVTDSENDCMVFSAKELRNYISDACGIDLNISYTEDGIDTYKIKYVFDKDDLYDLGKEGYRVYVDENGDAAFYCGSLRGPMYATYFFLEELVGYRFLTAERLDGGEFEPYLYKADNINIPIGFEETDVPEFSYRAAAHKGTNSFNFKMGRINAVDSHGSQNTADLKHGGGVGTISDHAFSYYALLGQNDYAHLQPCLTSADTFETILQSCIDVIETRKSWGRVLGVHYTQISVSPNHNENFCKCANCSAINKQEHSFAGTVFRFSNRIAEKLDELYPGIEVFTMAYWTAKFPPKITRPRENVCVCYAVGGCNNHPYDQAYLCAECGGNPRLQFVNEDDIRTNQNNTDCIGYFDEWTEVTSNIYVWYHAANFTYNFAPSPTLFNIYNDFQYLAEGGIEGIYCEGTTSSYYNFEYLRCYLITKMLWNPFMTEEEFNSHFNEFLMLYYGDGWEYIREYLEMNNYAADLNGCFINNYDRPWDMFNEQYYLENYLAMRELFDKALEAAKTDSQKERVRLATLHCDFLGLSATYERDYVNGDADAKALYKEHYQFLYDKIVEYLGKGSQSIKVTTYAQGKAGADNFPSTRDDIYSPMTWIDEGFTGHWEWNGASWQ